MNEYYLSNEKINKYFMKLIPDFSVFDIAERSYINNENNDLFYYTDIRNDNDEKVYVHFQYSKTPIVIPIFKDKKNKYNIFINHNIANIEIYKTGKFTVIFDSTDNMISNTNASDDQYNDITKFAIINRNNNKIGNISFSIEEIDETPESKKEKRTSLLTTTSFYRAIFKIIGISNKETSLLKPIDNNVLVKKYFINDDMYIIAISRGNEVIDLNKIIDINSDDNIDSDIKIIGVAF